MRGPLLKTILIAAITALSFWAGTGWVMASWQPDTAEIQLWRLAEKEQAELERSAALFHQDTLESYIVQISERLWGHAGTDMPPI